MGTHTRRGGSGTRDGKESAAPGPTSRRITDTVDLISYRRCRDGADVALYRAKGAGHTWPGSTFPAIGPIDQSINATKRMWKFFKRHPLRRSRR